MPTDPKLASNRISAIEGDAITGPKGGRQTRDGAGASSS